MQPQDRTVKINQSLSTQGSQDLLVPGQIVGEKYEVIAVLGAGGMGTVYKVRHLFLNKIFAMKTLDRSKLSEVSLRRFQQEAKAASSLVHPNLVHVYDFGLLDESHPFLVMDFVDGITFGDYLKQHGPLPIEKVLPFFAQACFGLLAAHDQHVVHRDIKPGNIMIVSGMPLGSEGSIKIVDFGIAKLTAREDGEVQALTRTGEVFGSPLYMSPEQCMSGAVDNRSDIYSLGCVLFEMLTGTPPHMGQNALATMMLHDSGLIPTLKEASLGKDFPPALERVVSKMLRRSADERYQNAGVVAHELAEACKGREFTELTPVKAVQDKVAKVISMTRAQLCGMLLATTLVAGAAGYGIRLMQVDSSKVADSRQGVQQIIRPADDYTSIVDPTPLENGADAKVAQEKRLLADFPGPITSIKEMVGGVPMRKFVFPDCGIGALQDERTQKTLAEALGTVSVDATIPIRLRVGGLGEKAAIETPSIYSKIGKSEFVAFSLSLKKNQARGQNGADSAQKSQSNTAETLKYVGSWTGLKDLMLDNMTVTDAMLAEFNNTKSLKKIRLQECSVGSSKPVNQAVLHQVEQLDLIDVPTASAPSDAHVDELLHAFYGSPNLRSVIMRRTPVSAVAMQKLGECRNLTELQLRYPRYEDQLIDSLSEFKSVETIDIADAPLSSAQINKIIKCSWLKKIKLSANNYRSPSEIERLKSLDRRIEFTQ